MIRHPTEPLSLWTRPLAIAAAGTFLLSSAFPIVAGLSKDTASFPRVWGIVDVSLAFVLAILSMAIIGLAQQKVDQEATNATYRAYRILLHGILAMIVIFFALGDRVVWINCLSGFAWRTWLLLYALPAWLIAVRK